MSCGEKVEKILAKAKEQEGNYSWAKAAVLYEQALPMTGKKEFLRKGELKESIGRCFYRAAFQAESQEEFKERMCEAVEAYDKAVGFYDKLMDKQKPARIFRCNAFAKYFGYWLTSDPSEKRILLDECLKLEGEALACFSESGEMLEFGRLYNELWMTSWLRANLEWSKHTKKSIIETGLKWGEKAVSALSQLGDSHELARAYHTLSTCLDSMEDSIRKPEDQEKNRMKIVQYLNKALRFSEKVSDDYLMGKAHQMLGNRSAVAEEATKHFKKALECGKRTRDNFRIAAGLQMLAYRTSVESEVEEDPERWRRQREKSLQFYDKAQHHYSIISFIPSFVGQMGPPSSYVEHYLALVKRETDPEKRLELLEKAESAGMKALKLAEDSEIPLNIARALSCLAMTLLARSLMESDLTQKKRLIERALKYQEKSVEILEEQEPFFFFNRGVKQTSIAKVKMELAGIESDFEIRQRLHDEAVLHMEKGLELINKKMPIYERSGFKTIFAFLRRDQDIYATMLARLYDLTKNTKHLRKSIEISLEAVNSARKLDLVSLIAESYWKIANAQDILGEHLKSAENFEHASKNYKLTAEKIPQLKHFYSDYALYMKAWAEIEKSRQEHKEENYARSRDHYQKCSRHLEMTKKWSYLSPYYSACSLLEHGEELSRLDKPQESMKALDEAGRTFGVSLKGLRRKARILESSEERDEAFKLATIAELRMQYCTGRVLMEEAKLLNRKGDRLSSAKKFASATRLFEGIAPNLEKEEARTDLKFAATLCQAWGKMELGEERREPTLFRKAAQLFAKAGEITCKRTAGLIAIGNSCFCKALELGTKFMATSNLDFYSGAKSLMENAADYYQKAGFDKAAYWVKATKRLFDAHVYAGKAEAEVEPEKRTRLYLVTEECLELSAKLYEKAGYPERRNEVLQSLESIRKERMVASSLTKVLSTPTVLSSTTGISMPDSTEKAAGLNEFKSVNIKARLSIPDKFIPGEEFQVKLDLVNVGKKPGLLVRVEGLVPRRCKVLEMPSYCTLEDDSLNMKGRRLNPLSVESVSISIQATGMAGVGLSPRVVYVDELGNFRTINVEGTKVLPVIEFESKVTLAIFNYLVDAFIKDYGKQKLTIEESGWRSFPQIIKGAGVSKKRLYGSGGRLGSGLSELQRNDLVDLRTFHGERGRGGHILRVRIHYKKELVKKYVKEKAPNLST